MSYYFPTILSGLSEGALADPDGTIASDDKKDQDNLILEEILRDIKDREQWSRIEVLTRCLSSFIDQEGVYLKTAALLTVSSFWINMLSNHLNYIQGTQQAKWTEFANCLRIADRYDMSRKVYQALDQDEIWNQILSPEFSKESRGDILDLWQTVSS